MTNTIPGGRFCIGSISFLYVFSCFNAVSAAIYSFSPYQINVFCTPMIVDSGPERITVDMA